MAVDNEEKIPVSKESGIDLKIMLKIPQAVYSKILFMVSLLLLCSVQLLPEDITPSPTTITQTVPSNLPELKAAYLALSLAYKQKMTEFQSQLAQLTKTYLLSEEQLAQLQLQFDSLTQDYQVLKQLSQTLETQSTQLTSNFQQLTQQYQELKTSIDSLIVLTESLKTLSVKLQKQNELLNAVVGYLGWGFLAVVVLETCSIALHFLN